MGSRGGMTSCQYGGRYPPAEKTAGSVRLRKASADKAWIEIIMLHNRSIGFCYYIKRTQVILVYVKYAVLFIHSLKRCNNTVCT